MIKTKKAGLLLSTYSVKVQQTPPFFFRWTKCSYHPAYLCEKILVIAFLLIFLEFFKVSNFGGSCGHNRALWRMGPSVIVTSSKELDLREQHGLLLKSSSGIMPDACVVFGCSRTADPQRGIGLHRIPIFDDSREESIKRGRKWVNFVQQRRAK